MKELYTVKNTDRKYSIEKDGTNVWDKYEGNLFSNRNLAMKRASITDDGFVVDLIEMGSVLVTHEEHVMLTNCLNSIRPALNIHQYVENSDTDDYDKTALEEHLLNAYVVGWRVAFYNVPIPGMKGYYYRKSPDGLVPGTKADNVEPEQRFTHNEVRDLGLSNMPVEEAPNVNEEV